MSTNSKALRKSLLAFLIIAVISLSMGAEGCPFKKDDDHEDIIAGSSAPLPSAVSSLAAATISLTKVSLSWDDNSNNEDGFNIERKAGADGTYAEVSTVNADVTSYTNTGLTDGATYYYRVRAHNANGHSSYSNEASAIVNGTLFCSKIAGGDYHTIALDTNGSLWTWGYNLYGQLGLGDSGTGTNRSLPTQVGSDTNWTQIATGDHYNMAIKSDGALWTWGANSYGQLGLDDAERRYTPGQVGTDTDWVQVVGGDSHTIGLKTNGTLWSWGYNGNGQLGLGDETNRLALTQVGTGTNWATIACSVCHTIAIKTDGTLWSWGHNYYGQLGLGDSETDRNTPTRVGTGTNWAKVASGDYHTMAIKTDGTLWAWGGMNYAGGILGLGDETGRENPTQVGADTNWSRVTCGSDHTIAIKTDGTIWSWGANNYGELGHGDNGSGTHRSSPTQVGTDTDWIAISCGNGYSLVLKSDNTLRTWGGNSKGQLGLGDTTNRNILTQPE